MRVSPAPIGTSRARGNRRHTGRQEFLILHTRSRNAPITGPGWVYKVLHIRQTYSTSRPLVGVSPVCCKPPYAALLSFFSPFPLFFFRPRPLRFPFSLSSLSLSRCLPLPPSPFLFFSLCFSLSSSLSLFGQRESSSPPVSTGYGRFGVLQRRQSTSITTFSIGKSKSFVVRGKCSLPSMLGLELRDSR